MRKERDENRRIILEEMVTKGMIKNPNEEEASIYLYLHGFSGEDYKHN